MGYVVFALLLAAIGAGFWVFGKLFDARSKRSTDDAMARASADDEERRARERAEREAFRKSARRLRAKITGASQLGLVNLKPNLVLSLRVEDPDGSYEVNVQHHVDFVELDHYREGRTVDVLVDPKDRDHVVVD